MPVFEVWTNQWSRKCAGRLSTEFVYYNCVYFSDKV